MELVQGEVVGQDGESIDILSQVNSLQVDVIAENVSSPSPSLLVSSGASSGLSSNVSPSPFSETSPSPSPSGSGITNLSFDIFLEGLGMYPENVSGKDNQEVTISIDGSEDKIVVFCEFSYERETVSGAYDFIYNCSLNDIPIGSYEFNVKGLRHLSKKFIQDY